MLRSTVTTGVLLLLAHGPDPSPDTDAGRPAGGGCAHAHAPASDDRRTEELRGPQTIPPTAVNSHAGPDRLTATANGLVFDFSPSTLYADVGQRIEIGVTIEGHAEGLELADATLTGHFVSVASNSMVGRELTPEFIDGAYRFQAVFGAPGMFRFQVRLTDPRGTEVRAELPMSISASGGDRPQDPESGRRPDSGGGHSH